MLFEIVSLIIAFELSFHIKRYGGFTEFAVTTIFPLSNPQDAGLIVGIITILLVVTVTILDNPIQPVPPAVTFAWKVDPEFVDIVVVPTGPVTP